MGDEGEKLRAAVEILVGRKGWSSAQLATAAGGTEAEVSKFRRGYLKTLDVIRERAFHYADKMDCDRQSFEQLVRWGHQYGLESADRCLQLGKTLTLWWPAVGVGHAGQEIAPADAKVRYCPAIAAVPPDPYGDLEREARREFARGAYDLDNLLLGLTDLRTGAPRGPERRPWFEIDLNAAPYAHFLALRRLPRGRELLRRRMQTWTPDDPVKPDISQGIGVHVAIHTTDEKLIFGRRSKNVGPRPGELDMGAVDGMTVSEDVTGGKGDSSHPNNIDVVRTMKRALSQEFGIANGDIEALRILGLGLDMQYGQWNILGLADIRVPGAEVRRRQKGEAVDGWEHDTVLAISDGPESVFSLLANEDRPVWSSALALAHYTSITLHGAAETRRAADDMTFLTLEQFLWK